MFYHCTMQLQMCVCYKGCDGLYVASWVISACLWAARVSPDCTSSPSVKSSPADDDVDGQVVQSSLSSVIGTRDNDVGVILSDVSRSKSRSDGHLHNRWWRRVEERKTQLNSTQLGRSVQFSDSRGRHTLVHRPVSHWTKTGAELQRRYIELSWV